MRMSLNNIMGIGFAVMSSASFGLIPLFSIPLLSLGLNSQTILCYRFLVATLIMAVVMLVTRRSFKLQARLVFTVFLLSALYAATAILLLASYKDIPSGVTTTIHFLYPLAVTVVMSIIYGEKTTITTYLAVLVSLLGVALLAWGNHDAQYFRRGVMLALMTVVCYAAYIIAIMKSRAAEIDTLVLTFYVLLFGTILFFVYALLTTGIEAIHQPAGWRDVVMLALVCTVLSDLTLIKAIKCIGSTLTSILGSMEPLTAVVVGVFYFDEHFDISSIVGLILIIISVVLVIAQTSKQQRMYH